MHLTPRPDSSPLGSTPPATQAPRLSPCRCNFLFLSFSGVPEYAIRLNPSLHDNCVNFNYDPKTQFGHWQQIGGEWKHDLGPQAQRIPPPPPPPRALLRRWAIAVTKLGQVIDNPQHRFNDYNDCWMAQYTLRRCVPEALNTVNAMGWTTKEKPLTERVVAANKG